MLLLESGKWIRFACVTCQSVCLLQNPNIKIVRVVVLEGVDLAKKDIFGLRYDIPLVFRRSCNLFECVWANYLDNFYNAL